jgi:hypothetical protein
MSNVKLYRRYLEETIVALEMLSHGGDWDACGLPEVLTHLQSVALDLKEGKVTRALGQYIPIDEKFERFSWAVKGFAIGPQVEKLYLGFVEVFFQQGDMKHSRKYGEFIRPDV